MKKNILVTGGAGFIGSNLINKLLKNENNSIICIDNFDTFYSPETKLKNIAPFLTNPQFTLVKEDIRDLPTLKNNIPEKIDVIVHLAAKAGVRPSIENPSIYQEVNVIGTQNMLEIARIHNVKQFVFGSSSSVYGENPDVPWKEDNKELMPISPYASTKFSGEMIGHVYSHLYGIRFIALRFFTVYGPGQRPDLAIHKFFKSILSNNPITMYGEGNTSRDYTFVDDITEGIVSAMNYQKTLFEIINLGNNSPVSLKQLIYLIEQAAGKSALIHKMPLQPGDVSKTFADISKAKKLLAYAPTTTLETGLKKFYEWMETSKLVA